MKRMMLALIGGLTLSCAHAEDGTTVIDLPWDSPYAVKVPEGEVTHPTDGPAVLTIYRTQDRAFGDQEDVYEATLFRMQNPKLVSSHYILTGEVAYQNLPSLSQLQLASSYLQSGTSAQATDEDVGPQKYLSGTSDFRPFSIRFSTKDPGQPLQLEINVKLFGRCQAANPSNLPPTVHPETFSLRNLKLVEYPNPPPSPPPPAPVAEAPVAAAPAAPVPSPGLD